MNIVNRTLHKRVQLTKIQTAKLWAHWRIIRMALKQCFSRESTVLLYLEVSTVLVSYDISEKVLDFKGNLKIKVSSYTAQYPQDCSKRITLYSFLLLWLSSAARVGLLRCDVRSVILIRGTCERVG